MTCSEAEQDSLTQLRDVPYNVDKWKLSHWSVPIPRLESVC